jgi:adenosylcobyric acid synthase
LIVAGLAAPTPARARVRPFKPQNMSNNAAVTADGGEIGRAQALQRARLTPPSVHMNPVLLEAAERDRRAGRGPGPGPSAMPRRAAYQDLKRDLLPVVLDSYARLQREADLVLVEGAGSASEVNLRAGDIANMGFARAAGVPGCIDRRH